MRAISFGGLAIVAAAALAAPLALGLFPRIRLRAMVLEIVLGIVLGPHVLGWVSNRHADPGAEPPGARLSASARRSRSRVRALSRSPTPPRRTRVRDLVRTRAADRSWLARKRARQLAASCRHRLVRHLAGDCDSGPEGRGSGGYNFETLNAMNGSGLIGYARGLLYSFQRSSPNDEVARKLKDGLGTLLAP